MAAITPTKTTWTALGAGVVQVRGGRVKLALSATPATNDFLVLSDGESIITTAETFFQSLDAGAVVVSIAV